MQLFGIHLDLCHSLFSLGSVFSKEVLLGAFPNLRLLAIAHLGSDSYPNGVLVDTVVFNGSFRKHGSYGLRRRVEFLLSPVSVGALFQGWSFSFVEKSKTV